MICLVPDFNYKMETMTNVKSMETSVLSLVVNTKPVMILQYKASS